MTKKQKILNLIFLLMLTGLISYLSLTIKVNNYKIEFISLEGNFHLSKEQYLLFANLLDKSNYKNLSLQIIKDRIEKHPYIDRADVRYDGNNKVSIKIYEKKFESILLNNQNQYILTEELEVLPFLPKTKNVDYPIISNVYLNDSVKVLTSLKNNYDVLTASKILSGIKFLNLELFDGLSAIDMNYGGDVILYFSNFDFPIIVGRGNEIKKVVYLSNLWNYLKGKEINNYMNYIDLRYAGHIYFGIQDSLQAGEKKS